MKVGVGVGGGGERVRGGGCIRKGGGGVRLKISRFFINYVIYVSYAVSYAVSHDP